MFKWGIFLSKGKVLLKAFKNQTYKNRVKISLTPAAQKQLQIDFLRCILLVKSKLVSVQFGLSPQRIQRSGVQTPSICWF